MLDTRQAPSPHRTLTAMLLLMSIAAIFRDYWEYSLSFRLTPDIWSVTLAGHADAPAQYRIGVLKAAEFLTLHTPLALRHTITLIDLASLLIAVFVLRALLVRSAAFRAATLPLQWLAAAVFLLLLQYSVFWLTWYQRPETLTIAALLALSLWFSTVRIPVRGAAGTILTGACLIALALLQGFTRADAGFTFHLGIALAALFLPTLRSRQANAHPTLNPSSFALTRWPQFLVSLAAAGTAAATQLYIMRVLYPHATYGNTPRFQLLFNYTDHIRVVPFALFLAPTLWLAVQVIRRRATPSPPQAGLLIAATLFTALWCVLGKIDEVRIFLPFAFALTPLTVSAVLQRLKPA